MKQRGVTAPTLLGADTAGDDDEHSDATTVDQDQVPELSPSSDPNTPTPTSNTTSAADYERSGHTEDIQPSAKPPPRDPSPMRTMQVPSNQKGSDTKMTPDRKTAEASAAPAAVAGSERASNTRAATTGSAAGDARSDRTCARHTLQPHTSGPG